MANSSIEQVCVTGAQLKQPIALVVLSVEALKLPASEIELSLLATLNEVNETLESHAVLDCLVVMKDEWTVDNGFLTPTLKVKRHNLEEHYKGLINSQLVGRIAWQ